MNTVLMGRFSLMVSHVEIRKSIDGRPYLAVFFKVTAGEKIDHEFRLVSFFGEDGRRPLSNTWSGSFLNALGVPDYCRDIHAVQDYLEAFVIGARCTALLERLPNGRQGIRHFRFTDKELIPS